jgi:hypothetical protein
MTKHLELRDEIRNIMKANDRRIATLADVRWLDEFDVAMADNAAKVLRSQNNKLQAILDAHK